MSDPVSTHTGPTSSSWWRRARASAGWFLGGVTGADAYERYCEHLARVHPDQPVPTRSDFWREKYAEQERNPKSRCC